MMGLPDGRKSFKIDLVILIQYWLWQTASQPCCHSKDAAYFVAWVKIMDYRGRMHFSHQCSISQRMLWPWNRELGCTLSVTQNLMQLIMSWQNSSWWMYAEFCIYISLLYYFFWHKRCRIAQGSKGSPFSRSTKYMGVGKLCNFRLKSPFFS